MGQRDLEARRGSPLTQARLLILEVVHYIEVNHDRFGGESVCAVLPIASSICYAAGTCEPSVETLRDVGFELETERVHAMSQETATEPARCGSRWTQGVRGPKGAVARLIRDLGLSGVPRNVFEVTTIAGWWDSNSLRSGLVLDALEMALYVRGDAKA